jgi:hypothetical protein
VSADPGRVRCGSPRCRGIHRWLDESSPLERLSPENCGARPDRSASQLAEDDALLKSNIQKILDRLCPRDPRPRSTTRVLRVNLVEIKTDTPHPLHKILEEEVNRAMPKALEDAGHPLPPQFWKDDP